MEEKEDSIREATEVVNNWLEDEKLKARLWSLVNDWNSLCRCYGKRQNQSGSKKIRKT